MRRREENGIPRPLFPPVFSLCHLECWGVLCTVRDYRRQSIDADELRFLSFLDAPGGDRRAGNRHQTSSGVSSCYRWSAPPEAHKKYTSQK